MGRDRYFYNRNGELRGFSSDEPPRKQRDWGCFFLLVGFLFLCSCSELGFENTIGLSILLILIIAVLYVLYKVFRVISGLAENSSTWISKAERRQLQDSVG